ncbi:hypothetical protein SRB5_59650 [Streptomyces sp. RB5]|uniref:Uncharacterized protein n=1 Tax=Streptomyces smaragdinus TaxID=2585196 RepID=A0A7K0CSS0_9ACTN|nr:hypothetical protein [Streptomyces smaragdinus]MQY15774.1 hypothetical protein [Streptomyces smaragdinus]
MTSSEDWHLLYGFARVFLGAGNRSLARPVVLVGPRGGDLHTLQSGADHPAYSLRQALYNQSLDLVLVSFLPGARLGDRHLTAQTAVQRALASRTGDAPIAVGGTGDGALAARYALAAMEAKMIDHQTGSFFTCDQATPTDGEAEALRQVGSWPRRPRRLGLAGDGGTGRLADPDYDDSIRGARAPDGALLSGELGAWLVSRLTR